MRSIDISLTRAAVVTLACVLFAGSATAQTPNPTTPVYHPYGLDPYRPTDAALLRNYGSALVARTPLFELATLDPYKPSHATLVRQLGGGIPLWTFDWILPGATCGPIAAPCLSPYPPQFSTFPMAGAPAVPPAVAPAGPSPAPGTAPADTQAPTTVSTIPRPTASDGISIRFEDRVWFSAGRALRLDPTLFRQAGEYAGVPVYRRSDVSEDVIYLRTKDEMIAPFRAR